MTNKIVYTFLLFFFIGKLVAQDSLLFDPVRMPIEKALPALSNLLDSAVKYSPLLTIKNKEAEISRLEEISTKRKWIEFASFEGRTSWGKNDNLTTDIIDNSSSLTTSNQFRYLAGIVVRIPFHKLFTLGLNNKIAKEKKEIAFLASEVEIKKIRELIIRQYSDLILAQNILVTKSENVQSLDVVCVMAEKRFVNGNVSLEELTQVRQNLSKAKEELATARNAFVLTYLLLQESTGIEFNLF